MCLLSERRLAKAEPPSPPHSTAVAEFLGGGLSRNPTPGVDRHVLNSSMTAGCRICGPFWAFQNHRSLRCRTQGVIMLSRARYCWPGSNYPVTLHDCSPSPPPSAASAAEAWLPVPRSTRASFSGVSPVPGSESPVQRCAGPYTGVEHAQHRTLAQDLVLHRLGALQH